MPTLHKNETQKEFVSRCIPIVHKEHPEMDNSQVVAVCYSLFRQQSKKPPVKTSTKIPSKKKSKRGCR